MKQVKKEITGQVNIEVEKLNLQIDTLKKQNLSLREEINKLEIKNDAIELRKNEISGLFLRLRDEFFMGIGQKDIEFIFGQLKTWREQMMNKFQFWKGVAVSCFISFVLMFVLFIYFNF